MKIAVLETQVERLLEKQKELTERVRANEKVVAAIGLFGSVAVAFIGAGYFAPSAEACSPRLDGEPTYCPDFDDVVLRDPSPTPRREPTPDYSNGQKQEFKWDPNQMIQSIREHEAEKTRTDPEDSINNALAEMEYEDGSNDTPKQEILLQLSSDEDSKSIGRGYDRCSDRSWIRFIQERTGKNCRSGHTREED